MRRAILPRRNTTLSIVTPRAPAIAPAAPTPGLAPMKNTKQESDPYLAPTEDSPDDSWISALRSIAATSHDAREPCYWRGHDSRSVAAQAHASFPGAKAYPARPRRNRLPHGPTARVHPSSSVSQIFRVCILFFLSSATSTFERLLTLSLSSLRALRSAYCAPRSLTCIRAGTGTGADVPVQPAPTLKGAALAFHPPAPLTHGEFVGFVPACAFIWVA